MQMTNCTKPSLCAVSQLTVRNFGDLIGLIDIFQVGEMNLLLIKFGLIPVLSRFVTINRMS